MKFKTIEMTEEGTIAIVRLNRPSHYNALDGTMAGELLTAAQFIERSPNLRAMVLTANGPAFCGGGDVKAFVNAGDKVPEFVASVVTPFHQFITQLMRMEKPSVAAINGVAAGGGFSLAMACDLVVAQEGASFTSAYSRIGATPDGGLSYVLPRLIGTRRTLELYLTNRILTATEALEWGLVNLVVPANKLLDEAHKIAGMLAEGPTLAFSRARDLIYRSMDHNFERQLELEAGSIIDSSRTDDFRIATRSFVEKVEPSYVGR